MDSRAPTLRSKAKWLAVIVLLSAATVAAIHALNSHLHHTYVDYGGPQKSLRVMSWNIGRVYLRWESRASDGDLAYVARVISQVNPHVVALQEIRDAKQLSRLVAMLGRNWRGRVPQDSYDRRAALLVRLSASFVQLPTSTGRTAQAALVKLPAGREILVASIHLDAFDPKRRMLQAEEIVAGLERRAREDIFLAGDFNFDVASTASSPDQGLYQFLTGSFVDAGKSAGATTLNARRLDYLFFRSPRLAPRRARVLRNRRVDSLDHHPLVIEFELNHPAG